MGSILYLGSTKFPKPLLTPLVIDQHKNTHQSKSLQQRADFIYFYMMTVNGLLFIILDLLYSTVKQLNRTNLMRMKCMWGRGLMQLKPMHICPYDYTFVCLKMIINIILSKLHGLNVRELQYNQVFISN